MLFRASGPRLRIVDDGFDIGLSDLGDRTRAPDGQDVLVELPAIPRRRPGLFRGQELVAVFIPDASDRVHNRGRESRRGTRGRQCGDRGSRSNLRRALVSRLPQRLALVRASASRGPDSARAWSGFAQACRRARRGIGWPMTSRRTAARSGKAGVFVRLLDPDRRVRHTPDLLVGQHGISKLRHGLISGPGEHV